MHHSSENQQSRKSRPKVVAFDVVETLFSLEPMRQRLRALGLADDALELWFARLLRNAFALDHAFESLSKLAAHPDAAPAFQRWRYARNY